MISGQNIIICNHVSYFDPFAIGYITYKYINEYWKIKFVAYHKVFEIPIVGYIVRSLGTIPIEMKETPIEVENIYIQESSCEMLKKCEKILRDGYSLFIFPEGRRNHNPSKLNKLKYGPYNLSKKTGCAIQVLSLDAIDKIWPAKGKPNGSGRITITKCDNPRYFDSPDQYRSEVARLMESGMSNL